ncbi:MAG TPA: EutN/CcmL family microcompartment protein [Spirochaetia bacterium]|nr:EutN/CcmL family microcompartment protein [Spirochaetia bacterium]
MTFARVVGTVVGVVRSDKIEDARFLLVEICDQTGKRGGDFLVALDAVGADRGQMVLLAQGSSCHWSKLTANQPIDTLIVAIVETVDESDKVVYSVPGSDA